MVPHGLGILSHDAAELAGLTLAFGDNFDRVPLAPIKGQISSLAAGCGVDAAAAVLALHHGKIPAAVNLDRSRRAPSSTSIQRSRFQLRRLRQQRLQPRRAERGVGFQEGMMATLEYQTPPPPRSRWWLRDGLAFRCCSYVAFLFLLMIPVGRAAIARSADGADSHDNAGASDNPSRFSDWAPPATQPSAIGKKV